eukprot:jgi/Orpsp1_1/1179139/evm.model.c7180000068089.1
MSQINDESNSINNNNIGAINDNIDRSKEKNHIIITIDNEEIPQAIKEKQTKFNEIVTGIVKVNGLLEATKIEIKESLKRKSCCWKIKNWKKNKKYVNDMKKREKKTSNIIKKEEDGEKKGKTAKKDKKKKDKKKDKNKKDNKKEKKINDIKKERSLYLSNISDLNNSLKNQQKKETFFYKNRKPINSLSRKIYYISIVLSLIFFIQVFTDCLQEFKKYSSIVVDGLSFSTPKIGNNNKKRDNEPLANDYNTFNIIIMILFVFIASIIISNYICYLYMGLVK